MDVSMNDLRRHSNKTRIKAPALRNNPAPACPKPSKYENVYGEGKFAGDADLSVVLSVPQHPSE